MPKHEVCQHCSHSVRASDAVYRGGYSYHKRCRKCYVCSETDLHGAEVFRGVIFCKSCAIRIFKGCSSVRRGRPRNKRRNRPRPRVVEHNIIERARAASYNSDNTSSAEARPQKPQAAGQKSKSTFSIEFSKPETAVPAREPRIRQDCYCVSDVVTQARQLINFIYYQTQNLVRSDRAAVSQCTEVCQRLLGDLTRPGTEPKNLKSQVLTPIPQSIRHLRPIPRMKSSTEASTSVSRCCLPTKRRSRKNKKMKKVNESCNDLRIAELGASVEIATMALRKTSQKKIPSGLKITEKTEAAKNSVEPETVSMFSNMEIVPSHTSNEEYVDSECQGYRGSKESGKGCVLNNVLLRGIVKTPCQFFKNKILRRSSLISVFVGVNANKECESAYKRLKTLFHNEILEHQESGYKKLYSTINKKTKPYKMGWLETGMSGDRKNTPCKHFHQCHSYRCMRTQVMRLAGPTQSKIYGFRKRIKRLVFPSFLKHVSFQYKPPSIQKQACAERDSHISKNSRSSHVHPRSSSSSLGQPQTTCSSQGQTRSSSSSQGQPQATAGLQPSRISRPKWGQPYLKPCREVARIPPVNTSTSVTATDV